MLTASCTCSALNVGDFGRPLCMDPRRLPTEQTVQTHGVFVVGAILDDAMIPPKVAKGGPTLGQAIEESSIPGSIHIAESAQDPSPDAEDADGCCGGSLSRRATVPRFQREGGSSEPRLIRPAGARQPEGRHLLAVADEQHVAHLGCHRCSHSSVPSTGSRWSCGCRAAAAPTAGGPAPPGAASCSRRPLRSLPARLTEVTAPGPEAACCAALESARSPAAS